MYCCQASGCGLRAADARPGDAALHPVGEEAKRDSVSDQAVVFLRLDNFHSRGRASPPSLWMLFLKMPNWKYLLSWISWVALMGYIFNIHAVLRTTMHL